jgi:HAD superfamily hydrolase (TIGR01484 family)
MKNISEFAKKIEIVLTDIDDTLTNDGLLSSEAYSALWKLHDSGIKVVPVTGRPAGWCELIARQWPVAGVIGENGGLYFRYHHDLKKMKRFFVFDEKTQIQNRNKLQVIQKEIMDQVPDAALASDQFTRLMDLAIDFCEDIPKLDDKKIDQIVQIFKKHGAQAKVSSIHVNGWFGEYNKVSTAFTFLKNEFSISEKQAKKICCFIGDSPNDEPLFEAFPNSFGVANIKNFMQRLRFLPEFVSPSPGGKGFSEIAEKIISSSC